MLPRGAMSSEYTLNGKIAAVNEVQVFRCWQVRCRR